MPIRLDVDIFINHLVTSLAVSKSRHHVASLRFGMLLFPVRCRSDYGAFSASAFRSPSVSVSFGKFVATVAMRASRVLVFPSAFSRAILHVVFIGAKEKMKRVDAGRIITAMANMKRVIKWEVVKEVCGEPMNKAIATCITAQSIAAFIFVSLKNPTAIWRNNECDVNKRLFHAEDSIMPRRLICRPF